MTGFILDSKNVLNGYNVEGYVYANDDVLITKTPAYEEITMKWKNRHISKFKTENENEDVVFTDIQSFLSVELKDSLESLRQFPKQIMSLMSL